MQHRARPGVRRCRRGHVKDHMTPRGVVVCITCLRLNMRKGCKAQRRKRLAQRRRRIAQRRKIRRTDRVWAAGHFEGEGTVTLLSGGAKSISRTRVLLSSTDRSVIDFFQATWPGEVISAIPPSKNGLAREAFRWSLGASEAVEGFLLDIRPFLKTARVRVKTDLLIEDIRERVQFRNTPEERRRKRERMARMRKLNRRGILAPREA